MDKLTPTADQDRAIEQMLREPVSFGGTGAALNGSLPGSGKSLMGVEVIVRMWARRSLIIGVPSTYDSWRDTLTAQSDGTMQLKLVGNKGYADVSTKDTKQNLADLLSGVRGHYFISRELFSSLDWEHKETGEYHEKTGRALKKRVQKHIYKKLNFDVAIYDESHMITDKKSVGFKTWCDITADLKIASSGTWFGNSFARAQWATYPLWPELIPYSAVAFMDAWCKTEYDHFSFTKKKITGEANPGAFAASLPCYIRVVPDIGAEPIPEVRHVDLSAAERKAYDELENNYVTWLGENPLVVEFPFTLANRLRQFALGLPSVQSITKIEKRFGEDVEVVSDDVFFDIDSPSAVYDEAKAIATELDEPVVFFTHSARYAKVAVDKFNRDAKRTVAGLLAGQKWQKTADKEAVKSAFLAGEIGIVVCVIQAAGLGLDGLQRVCRNAVFLSEVEGSEVDNSQALARLWRTGGFEYIRYIVIQPRGTRAEGVFSKNLVQALANNASRKVAS